MPTTALFTSALPQRTPLFVLTGFLGSGKTTLLNGLLRSADFADTAVIVNEFGDIGLDHHLIAGAADNVVLLESGCLCCALVDSLEETLADLHRRRAGGEITAFRRVVIETSGLADPGPILNTLLGHRLVTDHYRLCTLVCAVDAQQAPEQAARHAEARRQIAMADRLLLTKCDLASPPQRAAVQALCAGLNPTAACDVVEAGTPTVAAFDADGGRRALPAFLPVPSHDATVRAHCYHLEVPVTWSGIAAWTRLLAEEFGDGLLRIKALLRVGDPPLAVFVQGVGRVFHRPERLPGWPDIDARGRIVCIVQNVPEPALRASLAALSVEEGIDARLTLADLQACTNRNRDDTKR